MTVHLNDLGLTYVSAPKCACSSAKLFLHMVGHGTPFRRKRLGPTIHRTYPTIAFRRLPFDDIQSHVKIALVRGPVDRLLSAYENKVVDGGVLSRPVPRGRAAVLGLPTRPDLETFVANLDAYRRISRTVADHTRPLSYHLGSDPAWFDRIFDVSRMHQFRRFVETHAEAAFGPVGQKNKSRGTYERRAVPEAVKTAIRARFAEDYALFGPFMAEKPSEDHCA